MQLGFVIDHSRCIGCHACTVACKSENDVQLGSFRTWVKYVEEGEFPLVKRSFAVLRCNQCSNAPCVTICPVKALHKRSDGIVDIDPQRCIGCKGCMQACPYDALYINERKGVAEKCHFCAHRTEVGLAPACAVVCPTEAIVPGDFHDPQSRVSQMKREGLLTARKPEAGTRPNVLYKQVTASGISPELTNAAGGYLWANQATGAQLDAEQFDALERRAQARTVYDVDHAPAWGGRVSAYLWTKSIAAGAFLAAVPLLPPFSLGGGLSLEATVGVLLVALAFLLLTTALLVFDLKRPERFLYILRYANWDSWIARGSIVLTGYGALLGAWLAWAIADVFVGNVIGPGGWLVLPLAVFALLSAIYTAWLFGQARGRVLWMGRLLAPSLAVHAVVSGAAALLLLAFPLGLTGPSVGVLRIVFAIGLAVQLLLSAIELRVPPARREAEYERAALLIHRGPYAGRHRYIVIGVGILVPLALLALAAPWAWLAAAAFALVGIFTAQDTLVRAGQAPAIS